LEAFRAPWSSASFLAYLGGFTLLPAAGSLLSVEANDHGPGAFVLGPLIFAGLAAPFIAIALALA